MGSSNVNACVNDPACLLTVTLKSRSEANAAATCALADESEIQTVTSQALPPAVAAGDLPCRPKPPPNTVICIADTVAALCIRLELSIGVSKVRAMEAVTTCTAAVTATAMLSLPVQVLGRQTRLESLTHPVVEHADTPIRA